MISEVNGYEVYVKIKANVHVQYPFRGMATLHT